MFPQHKRKQKKHTKKSNNASLEGYDKQCWRARQEYHKARQIYNLHKNIVNFQEMTEKSRKY